MKELILSPLDYYQTEAKQKHAQYTASYIAELAKSVSLNREENAKTAQAYRVETQKMERLNGVARLCKTKRGFAIFGLIVVSIVMAVLIFQLPIMEAGKVALTAGALIATIVVIVVSCKSISRKLKLIADTYATIEREANTLLQKAYEQAEPLNALFTGREALCLVQKTLPFLIFDECFSRARLDDICAYGYTPRYVADECITGLLSGELYGYPFFYERRLACEEGVERYTGSLHISWTTQRWRADGKMEEQYHSQTLHASVTKMKPFYTQTTQLHYGNDVASELCFSREGQRVNEKSDEAIERRVRRGERKIERMETKASRKDKNFTGMTNVEFDVLFGALNRTDELQFRQMYTSVGQEETLKLLLSDECYGDDFDFYKNGKLNTLCADHTQFRPLTLSADEYRSYDIALAEQAFKEKNEAFFKAIYFDFAPLLCVPAYQEPLARSEAIRGGGLTPYNYEEIAYILSNTLTPEGANTAVVFKTQPFGEDELRITAYAYHAESRRTYVPVFGGDGHMHDVPVDWVEYIPVQRQSVVSITREPRPYSKRYGDYYINKKD